MPTHWYSCKCIRHRMGTGVERLKEIDAANLKFITCFFVRFFFPYSLTADSHHVRKMFLITAAEPTPPPKENHRTRTQTILLFSTCIHVTRDPSNLT